MEVRSFWRADQLCRVLLKRTSHLQGQTSAEVCLLSYLMGAFSPKPILISCTGCCVRTVQLLDQSPYSSFSNGPPRFEEFNLSQLLHKKRNSVFGRIDFFSMVKYLVVSVGGSVELDWVLLSPELSKVCCIPFTGSIFHIFGPTREDFNPILHYSSNSTSGDLLWPSRPVVRYGDFHLVVVISMRFDH